MSAFQLIQTDAATAVSSRAPTKPVVLGSIDKTLNTPFAVVAQALPHKVYRLVEAQTQQLVKGQRLVRKGNNLLVEVDGTVMANLTGFFSNDASPGSAQPGATPPETKLAPGAQTSTGAQYVFDAELADGSYGLINHTSQGTAIADGSSLIWAPGQTPAGVVNPQAVGLVPVAALGGGGAIGTGALLGGAAVVGAVAVAGGGKSAEPGAAEITQANNSRFVQGVIKAGDVVASNDLRVDVYSIDGNGAEALLNTGAVGADGAYRINVGSYTGAVRVRVVNTGGLPVVDSQAPVVAAVAISGATGAQNNTLNAGDVVTVTVRFDEAVTVTGTPQLALQIGTSTVLANYASGSGGRTLSFSYTIQPGQTDLDGISVNANSLSLNGGTVRDMSGNNATLTHALVAANTSYLVDTTAPTTPASAPSGYTDNVGSITSATSTATTTDDTTPGIFVGTGLTDTPKLYVDDILVAATYDREAGTLTPNSAVGEGSHTFKYSLTDSAHNESGKSPAITIVIDSTLRFTNLGDSSVAENAAYTSITPIVNGAIGTLTYTLGGEDASRFTVISTDGSLVKSQAFTVKVINVNDLPTGSVTVTGTATQGQTLTATNTLADADGLGTVSLKWQSSTDGTTWTDIAGATATTFTLTQSEVGKKVRALASYTDGQGTAESVASNATATNVANVNDLPVVGGTPSTKTFTEMVGADNGTNAVLINNTVTVSDADGSSEITTATVQITNVQDGDQLLFTNTTKITGVYTAGTLTLSKASGQTVTDADFQAAMRQVTFNNTSNTPNTTARTITFKASDASASSSTFLTETVNVVAVSRLCHQRAVRQ